MKPPTRKIFAAILACAWMLALIPHTAAGDGDGKKKKKGENGSPSPTPAKVKDGGSIPLPMIPGRPAENIRIPDMDVTGKVLSLLMAAKATRLDDDHLKMEKLEMDFNKPDGKEDFHVVMPASVLNLKTHLITSEDPVTVKTQDFELTGEKMEFNTVEREGRLVGNVRMVIHNMKGLSGQQAPTQKTE